MQTFKNGGKSLKSICIFKNSFFLQGVLIGSGASLFGIGSDIAGSIRVPSLFNGIFGHKPTGGLLSIINHFPFSADPCFSNYLVVGPMCRYAKDLPTLLHIMAGKKADKLRLNEPLYTKDVKVNIVYVSCFL